MKFIGLNGREYRIDPTQYSCNSDRENKSAPHLKCRAILKDLFPFDIIIEEFPLPGSRGAGTKLYSDFFIPARGIMVEVHGKQHFEYSPFFHGSKEGFIKSKKRDKEKREWAEKNNITLIVLKDSEIDEWRTTISLRGEESN